MHYSISRLVGLVAGVAVAASGHAAVFTGLGAAADYNIYVLGNNTQAGSDAGGSGTHNGIGIAVGGNFNTTATTVHGNVIVRGNFSNVSNTINGSVIAGSVNYSNPSITGTLSSKSYVDLSGGGGSVNGGIRYVTTYAGPNYFTRTQVPATDVVYPFDFDESNTYLTSLSSTIASNTVTPGATVTGGAGNQLKLTGTGSDSYLFRVNASQLANMNDFLISVTGATSGVTPTVIVDVFNDTLGGNLKIHNNGITLNGTDKHHVLYNFNALPNLDTNGIGILGSLLAPGTAVAFNSGNIDGHLIAGSLSGNGETHAFRFLGELPAVPEPATLTALVAAAIGLRRVRRAA